MNNIPMFLSFLENPKEKGKRLIHSDGKKKILHIGKGALKTSISCSNCRKIQNTWKHKENLLFTNHKNKISPFQWRNSVDLGIRFLTFHLHGWDEVDFKGGAWAIWPIVHHGPFSNRMGATAPPAWNNLGPLLHVGERLKITFVISTNVSSFWYN